MHQNSPLVSMFDVRAEVTILTTDAFEQQHDYQIMWSTFNQSVLFVMSDFRRVFDVDDISTRRARFTRAALRQANIRENKGASLEKNTSQNSSSAKSLRFQI